MKCNCGSNTTIQYNNGHFCSLCLKKQEIKRFSYKWLYFIFTFIMCIWLVIPSISEKNSFIVGKYSLYKNSCDDIQLNEKAVFQELLNQDILFPEFALKSSVYESGHFKSRICLEGNNIFGITYVKSKYQIGWIDGQEGLKFGKYASVKDCIKHYKQIQANYAKNIDRKYSDNKDYTNSLK